MKQKDIKIIVGKFQESYSRYHKLFLENYPLFSTKEYDFGSNEMNELGLECQSYISMLGDTVKSRMNFIGFNQLFAFDNPVDWYNWKIWINENKIDHTQYLSISMRIETEIKRILFFLKEDMWKSYCELKDYEYSISYLEYKDFQPVTTKASERNKNITRKYIGGKRCPDDFGVMSQI